MSSRAVYNIQEKQKTIWHNAYTEEDKNADVVAIKSLSFNSVRYIIIMKLEPSSKHNRCKIAY